MSDTAGQIETTFAQLPERLNPTAAQGLDAVIQFDLSGEGGGQYYAIIANGACEVNEGRHDSPTMTVSMAGSDFVDLIQSRLDGMSAFMSGRLRVSGDMGLAMKLQSLFA
ncbi:MAG TPA: SCP2 sterol-binding domain-containing protein [Thermoanaerobaculia bacterium]|nr:SCP2 sterol-binding domain-containing protein [Thermoanaerobaculia bacterium]